MIVETFPSHSLSRVPLPAVQAVTVCSRSFVTLGALDSLARRHQPRYDFGRENPQTAYVRIGSAICGRTPGTIGRSRLYAEGARGFDRRGVRGSVPGYLHGTSAGGDGVPGRNIPDAKPKAGTRPDQLELVLRISER